MNDDLISRLRLIKKLKQHKELFCRNRIEFLGLSKNDKARANEINNCIATVINMPPAQPENVDCIYCHEDSDGYVKPIEKNCHAFIRFGMNGWEISLSAKGWSGSAKIMYCPMCGRKLKNDK
jgi:hypothetical protein